MGEFFKGVYFWLKAKVDTLPPVTGFEGDGTTFAERFAETQVLRPYDPSKHTFENDPGPILGLLRRNRG